MSPPSFPIKTKQLLNILKSTYGIETTLATEITKENIDMAMPARCKDLAKAATQKDRDEIGAERLPKDDTLSKFALLRWDELNELALYVEQGLGAESSISRDALVQALGRIKDSKSRPLEEYCRFVSDREDYERFDVSKNSLWRVTEIEGFADPKSQPPKPVRVIEGERFIDAPVGPIANVRVPGFTAERVGPGKIRLKKVPVSNQSAGIV